MEGINTYLHQEDAGADDDNRVKKKSENEEEEQGKEEETIESQRDSQRERAGMCFGCEYIPLALSFFLGL